MSKTAYFKIIEIDRMLSKKDPDTGEFYTLKKACSTLKYEDGPDKGKYYDYEACKQWKHRNFKTKRRPISHERKLK